MKKRNATERKKERQRVRLIGSVPSAHLNANHPGFCLSRSLSHTHARQTRTSAVILTMTDKQGRWLSTYTLKHTDSN